MEINATEINVNGIVYIPKDSVKNNQEAEKLDGLDYVIIRATNAGVFAGYLESQDKDIVILRKARRLWYWSGAASLSQMAVDGTCKPNDCKFPCEVGKIKITNVIETIFCTAKAQKSIQGVKVWEQK